MNPLFNPGFSGSTQAPIRGFSFHFISKVEKSSRIGRTSSFSLDLTKPTNIFNMRTVILHLMCLIINNFMIVTPPVYLCIYLTVYCLDKAICLLFYQLWMMGRIKVWSFGIWAAIRHHRVSFHNLYMCTIFKSTITIDIPR